MEGSVIVSAQVNRPNLRWPFPENMAARLTGARITALGRRSKYILADLDRGETLIIHLGMSGRMTVSGGPTGRDHPAPQKHDHVVFDMDNGARIAFNDARRFGAMDLAPTATVQDHKLLAKLGPEPIGNTFNESYLITALAGRNTPIKSALLDQRIIAGLGNIYVCEALLRARISPTRKAKDLAKSEISTLTPIIRDVISEAIDAGGSSLKDYRQADGELGYFQHVFKAYGRENAPCLTPGCPDVIHRITQAGRSTFYCPTCQR